MFTQIKTGDILFSFGKGIVGELIEDITSGPSHTCVISEDTTKVIEAQYRKVVGYCDISFYSSNIKIYRLPNTDENIDCGIKWLHQQFGRKYDDINIFILLLRCIFKLKIPWHEIKKFICSGLTRGFIFNSKLNIPDTDMTPKDVEDWVIANGGVLIVDTVK